MTSPHHDDPVSGLPGAIQVGTLITLIFFVAKSRPASPQLENQPENPVSIVF
jgi:hypothetical protein